MGKPLKHIRPSIGFRCRLKTVASLITMVAIGTWAFFGMIETQNRKSTTQRNYKLMEKDLVENEQRI